MKPSFLRLLAVCSVAVFGPAWAQTTVIHAGDTLTVGEHGELDITIGARA